MNNKYTYALSSDTRTPKKLSSRRNIHGLYRIRNFLRICSFFIPGFCCITAPSTALGIPLTSDSILVTFWGGGDTIGEFTRQGQLLQLINVPYPGGQGDRPTESVRDISLNTDGTLAIFNGTFNPYLTIWNPADNSFRNETLPGWSSDGNLNFGALAPYKNYIFATDNGNYYDSTIGIVRFDLSSPGNAQRFNSINPVSISVGLDGLLYVLGIDGMTVQVFDPQSMSLLRTITLQRQIYSITANDSSNIIGTSNMGGLMEFDPIGHLVLNVPGDGLNRIKIAEDGTILASTIYPEGVFIADESLTGSVAFQAGSAGFIAFGPTRAVSEPPILGLFLFPAVYFASRRYLRSRKRVRE